ncbi:MAG: metal-dependent transcriptional regulator [Candidatus Eisenbacteria bacterium]|nr:metal-dependent transcriptional regulator [Candidatus Eisenbacteria bacterium]
MPSATMEEYLEAIYKLAEKGPVRPTPIAESLGVSGPTVTATLKRLQSQGLIERVDGDVVLTKDGHAAAIDIVRRHRISERFLVDVLGLSWDEAHEEACMLEHALSPRVLEALEEYLDNPVVCPHGHPIPHRDGTVAPVVGSSLCTLSEGSEVRIVQVEEDDDAMLTYLGSMGMFPGTHIKVCEVAPFKGPIIVEVDGSTYALGREVADRILVTAGDE